MARSIPDLPHPGAALSRDGRIEREWWNILDSLVKAVQERISITGTATFAGTVVDVALSQALPDANYNVAVDASENKTFWTTDKTTSGFKLRASSASTATVGWTLCRR